MMRSQKRVLAAGGALRSLALLFPPWRWGYAHFGLLHDVNPFAFSDEDDGVRFGFVLTPPRTPTLTMGTWDISDVPGNRPDGTWSLRLYWELLAVEIGAVAICAFIAYKVAGRLASAPSRPEGCNDPS